MHSRFALCIFMQCSWHALCNGHMVVPSSQSLPGHPAHRRVAGAGVYARASYEARAGSYARDASYDLRLNARE